METTIISQRLKELRHNAGLTQVELSNALSEKLNIGINVQTIKKYESSSQNLAGIRLENICAFADFYNVPTDYILGRIDSTSVVLTEQAVYETLGLSEKAVYNLKKLCKNRKLSSLLYKQDYNEDEPIFVINSLLSNFEFMEYFPMYMLKYCFQKAEKEVKELEKAERNFHSDEIKRNKSFEALQNHLALVSSLFDIKYRDENRYFAINQIETFINDFYKKFLQLYKMDLFKQSPDGQIAYKQTKEELKEFCKNKQKKREEKKLNAKKDK